jgi:Cof subfamily protein (haloacid dehalogenase superfamily)
MQKSSKALFLDIDGTLISKDRGPFEQDIVQIKAARKQGHRVYLNSGRSFANLPLSLKSASYIDGMVLGGGTQVVFNGETIYHRWIPCETLAAICGYYLSRQKWCIFEGENNIYGINNYDTLLFAEKPFNIKENDDFIKKYPDAIITKLTIEGKITAEEKAFLGGHFQLNAFPDYFEGILKGEDKSKGMEIMLKSVGISRENSIAIGDSINDIGAIRFAGLGIAMGNACGELKKAAHQITDDCENGGVGKAIQHWVLDLCG